MEYAPQSPFGWASRLAPPQTLAAADSIVEREMARPRVKQAARHRGLDEGENDEAVK